MPSWSSLRLMVLGALLLSLSAFGQGPQSGAITGLVKDATGAVIPSAKVEIYNAQTETLVRTLTSGSDGGYSVTLLPPGTYRIQVTASGFKQYRANDVPVRINETTRHDAQMEVGTVQEAITVEATPSLVSTVGATTGQPIDAPTLAALPLPVPNFMFLLALSPGTAGEPPDVRSANRGIVDINVNGQRTSNNSVSIEGVNVNDFNLAHFDTIPIPNPNAIQEFKVATSLYDASMGSKGGGAVTLVMKTGTKDWHGDLNWAHRNEKLNANEWFRNQQRLGRARLLQNVFGGSVGGPMPLLGGFWFGNYQGVRARNGIDPNGATASPLVQAFPTAGDGSTSAALLTSAFGLSAAQIDPIAVNILNLKSDIFGTGFLVPRPGLSGCASVASATATFRCNFSKIAPLTANQFTITYDRPIGDRHRLGVRWFWDEGDTKRPFGTASNLPFPSTAIQNNRFASVNYTHLISSRQTNEIRVGFNRFISSFAPQDLITLDSIGATRPNKGEFPGMYQVAITGLAMTVGTGVNDDRGTISNTYYIADTWSISVGRHTIRAGGDVTKYQLNRYNRFASRGALTFGATTGAGNTFTPFQNFLQGRITALQSAAGDSQRYFRAIDGSGFFQDDWRIHPRLTLNVGLRWELMNYSHDKFFKGGIYDPVLAAAGKNPFLFSEDVNIGGFTGTSGVPPCALAECFDKNNWAPRVGFAWDVRGNQKWVLRGGYGIYYQRLSNQNLLQGSLAPPFFVQLIDARPTPQALQLRDPLAGQPPSAAIATNFIPQWNRFAGVTGDINAGGTPIFVNEAGERCANYGGAATNCAINLASYATSLPGTYTPYTQQWNLMVQRQIGRGWATEFGYVGSHYIGGLGIWNPYLARLASPTNPISVTDTTGRTHQITTNTTQNEPLRHQILGLSRTRGARFADNIGQAIYHSGQLTVSRRFFGGLFFQSGYTWAKSIDNVSGSQSTDELNATRAGQGGANILNFQGDQRQNRARGDFDRTHRLVVSYNYELPFPKNGIWGTQLFQGWSISGITTFQSGLPFSIFNSASGGAFGATGIGTGVLECRPAAQQIASLPGCAPGTATTVDQLLRSGRIQDRLNNYLNPNFVTTAAIVPSGAAGATGYGNVPRNAFRGPFQQNWDFSVSKKFRLHERHSLMFRMDLFNLWNHPIFTLPSTVTVDTPATFGQILNTVIPARLVQFGLRYQF